jgi:ADP-ribosylglycohydrolase
MVSEFHRAGATHPFAAGLAAGTVTDDTEQALILAQVILESGRAFDAGLFAQRLLAWESDVQRRGLFDLLGPSTKRALENIESGMDLSVSGRGGTTNGAAMRIAPVGIVCASDDLTSLVDRVVEVCAPTHNSSVAIGAACAVAAAVSAGISGATLHDATHFAVRSARMGETRALDVQGPSVADRIEVALQLGASHHGLELLTVISEQLGSGLESIESVPASFALLASYEANSWEACCAAASLGGDCDTIGAMTGAMAGSLAGSASFPPWSVSFVESHNSLDLASVARDLLALRR